jgi:hypothetical protein
MARVFAATVGDPAYVRLRILQELAKLLQVLVGERRQRFAQLDDRPEQQPGAATGQRGNRAGRGSIRLFPLNGRPATLKRSCVDCIKTGDSGDTRRRGGGSKKA